jgi:hypothetical protein
MRRNRQMLVVVVAMAVLSLGIGQTPAAAAENGTTSAPTVTAGSADDPAQKPGSLSADRPTSPACTTPAAGKFACVKITRPHPVATRPSGGSPPKPSKSFPTGAIK